LIALWARHSRDVQGIGEPSDTLCCLSETVGAIHAQVSVSKGGEKCFLAAC
jgi:hypothetical protein